MDSGPETTEFKALIGGVIVTVTGALQSPSPWVQIACVVSLAAMVCWYMSCRTKAKCKHNGATPPAPTP